MKGGHNRKPTALKVLEGTARRDRLKNEPKPRPIRPRCPRWLPPEAKRKWRELTPKLERLGVLTELDGEKLATACLHWSLMIEAAKDVKERGILIPSAREDGALVKNPGLQILRDNSAAFCKIAGEFGLDPVNRGRIDVAINSSDEESEFERLLTKR